MSVNSWSWIVFRVEVDEDCWQAGSVAKILVVGDVPELGAYHLHGGITLQNQKGTHVWESEPVKIPTRRFPIKYKVVANGHRRSPTTRPMLWDVLDRAVEYPPPSGVITCVFNPSPSNSGSGWVSKEAAGAFQLRVGQLAGSTDPLVELAPSLANEGHPTVVLSEAVGAGHGRDPKPFFKLQGIDLDHLEGNATPNEHFRDRATFIMNAPSLQDLAFRVDVFSTDGTRLLARGLCSHEYLTAMEGPVTVPLLTPSLEPAGTLRAWYLVVKEFDHPNNNLGALLRQPWSPGGGSLNIGHRGAGESQTANAKLVRENTLLSFMTAASSKAMQYIEFDAHLTRDGEVVIYHDYDVKLFVGGQVVRVGIPTLSLEQLQSEDFQQHMASHLELADARHQNRQRQHRKRFDDDREKRRATLKRSASGDETLFRDKGLDAVIQEIQAERAAARSPAAQSSSHAGSPSAGSPRGTSHEDAVGAGVPGGVAVGEGKEGMSQWTIQDRVTTLREMFQRLPRWLGFNIEIKYPPDAVIKSMPYRMYDRNHFVDTVLRVVFEEARGRKVIFSTFDPDCATLLSLKQPRFPVFFLTCSGTEVYSDPRMNSIEAAIAFSRASMLQGIVAESSPLQGRVKQVVDEAHKHGLYLFTWGAKNNDLAFVNEQRKCGVDAVISDDLFRFHRASTTPEVKPSPIVAPMINQDLLQAPLAAKNSVVPVSPFSTASINRPPSLINLAKSPPKASSDPASVPGTEAADAEVGSEEAVDGKSDVSLAVEGALHALELGQGAEGMLGGLSEGSNDDGLEWSVLTRPLPDAPEEIDAGGP